MTPTTYIAFSLLCLAAYLCCMFKGFHSRTAIQGFGWILLGALCIVILWVPDIEHQDPEPDPQTVFNHLIIERLEALEARWDQLVPTTTPPFTIKPEKP